MLHSLNRIAFALLLLVCAVLPCENLSAADPESDPEIWTNVRNSLFGDRPLQVDNGSVLVLDTPYRAEDAANVPVAIRTRVDQGVDHFIHKIYLIIDKNPSPIAAVFTFSRDSGRADIETRVRIEEYTHIRAIAEFNSGELFMVSRFIKAAGGCSSPSGKDAQAALSRLGKLRLSVDERIVEGRPTLAQLMIAHPNFSGLAMDQTTRLYSPPHYVRSINVTYRGKLIVSAEVDFAISENPHFRFFFVPQGVGELSADVVDNKELHFKATLPIGIDATLR